MSGVSSPVTADPLDSSSRVFFLTLFILAVLVVVASYLFVLLISYGFIFFTSEGLSLIMQTRSLPVLLLFFLIGFYTPEVQVGAVFGFLLTVYVLCFIVASQWRERFSSVIEKLLSRPFRSLFNNFLFAMPLLSSMIVMAAWVIIFSQEAVGIPTGQLVFPPDISLQEIFLSLAYAPIREELGYRLVPLGLFTLFHVFLTGRNVAGKRMKLFFASFFYPDGAKRLTGLRNVGEHGFWRGISTGEWAMVLITSVVFGYAHVISGIGWEAGKISSVFVQAFFLAIAYLVYGFEAPILLHWFFNYYMFFFDPDVISRFFPSAEPIFIILELIIMALGIVGWTSFAVYALRRWRKRRTAVEKKEVPLPPASVPPPPESTLPS